MDDLDALVHRLRVIVLPLFERDYESWGDNTDDVDASQARKDLAVAEELVTEAAEAITRLRERCVVVTEPDEDAIDAGCEALCDFSHEHPKAKLSQRMCNDFALVSRILRAGFRAAAKPECPKCVVAEGAIAYQEGRAPSSMATEADVEWHCLDSCRNHELTLALKPSDKPCGVCLLCLAAKKIFALQKRCVVAEGKERALRAIGSDTVEGKRIEEAVAHAVGRDTAKCALAALRAYFWKEPRYE